jgi:eukaryotic-like serine/threonine-protein kinase
MDIGQLLGGRYRLLRRLGVGGMSVVWCARDEVLEREVAVKVLSPDLAADPDRLQQVRIEARSAAGLRHPNVVEVYDYGQGTDVGGVPTPFVVMELVDGRSLSQLLSGGPLPWRLAALIGAQVAAALAAAHARGIVHRDVKPSNVMVTADGVKLVDFGISAAVGAADGVDGLLLGTPAYLAPERLHGGLVRPATDVYALGLLLYKALAGCLPWQAATTTQMLRAHRYREPAALPAVAGLPPEVADLCRRCLAKEPAQRPTAVEAATILSHAVGLPHTALLLAAAGSEATGEPVSPTTVAQVAAPLTRSIGVPWAKPRRPARRVVVAAAGAVAVLASMALADGLADGPNGSIAEAAIPAAVRPPMPRRGCTVRYALRAAAGGRSSTAVTVVNTGDTPLAAWQLTFALPADQRVLRGWNGQWRQQGSAVRATGGSLRPGGSAATGFDGSYRTATTPPTQFRVDGVTCLAQYSAVAAATAHPVADRPHAPATKGSPSKSKAKPQEAGAKKPEPRKPKVKKPKPKPKLKPKAK